MLVSLPEGKFFSPIPWFLLSRHDLLHFASSSSASNFQLSKRFPSRSFLTRAPDSGLTFPQRPIFWDENRPKQRWNASKNHWKPTIHFSFTYPSLSVPVFLLKIIHFACDIQLFAGEIHIYLATLKFAILFMPFYSTPDVKPWFFRTRKAGELKIPFRCVSTSISAEKPRVFSHVAL